MNHLGANLSIILIVCAVWCPMALSSERGYDLDWHTVDAGGAILSGNAYQLTATIGQPDAGPPVSTETYTLLGGFWSHCCADLDGDGRIGVEDLLMLLADWGCPDGPPCVGDVDGDGNVNTSDLLLLLATWGPCW